MGSRKNSQIDTSEDGAASEIGQLLHVRDARLLPVSVQNNRALTQNGSVQCADSPANELTGETFRSTAKRSQIEFRRQRASLVCAYLKLRSESQIILGLFAGNKINKKTEEYKIEQAEIHPNCIKTNPEVSLPRKRSLKFS